jgi:hypothetical protein
MFRIFSCFETFSAFFFVVLEKIDNFANDQASPLVSGRVKDIDGMRL